MFAIGQNLQVLNCVGLYPRAASQGLLIHEVQARLQGHTPYEMEIVSLNEPSVFGLVQLTGGIFVAVAFVELHEAGTTDTHALVWDAWRSLLFIGPGNFDDKQTDGCLMVTREDINSRFAVTTVALGAYSCTLAICMSAIIECASVWTAWTAAL